MRAVDAAQLSPLLLRTDGRIFLLTHLRYLGYGFNPVSFFYCFDRAEQLQVVLAEVSNTFGGTHNYWLRPEPVSRMFRAAATKSLYVSPFMPAALEYTFVFTPPAGRLVAHMETSEAGSVGFDATLSLERRPWNATEIRRVLVRHPAMTASVTSSRTSRPRPTSHGSTPTRRCCRCGRQRAPRGTTGSPPTPTRRRR